MKAHLIDTHLVPRSRSSAKVKVKYQGHVSGKMGVSGALVFRKHILFKKLPWGGGISVLQHSLFCDGFSQFKEQFVSLCLGVGGGGGGGGNILL